MDPQQTFCPNPQCPARGQRNRGNIVIHSQKQRRYRCKQCGKTFSERYGTVFFRAREDYDIITLVLTLLASPGGCPLSGVGHRSRFWRAAAHRATLDASGRSAL